MTLRYTLKERTIGLAVASLVPAIFFGAFVMVLLTFSILSLEPEAIGFSLIILTLVFFVSFVCCQVFGQIIWLISDLIGIHKAIYAGPIGMFTGVIIGLTYNISIDKNAVDLQAILFGGLIGFFCGLLAYGKAEKMRDARLKAME